MYKTKSFKIKKNQIWQAWLMVKKNKGSCGIDHITLEKYEMNLKDNLYKLWNRMSSGTYFPKEVKEVAIPKGNGDVRILRIPTVEDRIAQTVVANILNERVDSTFHENSYGFRPKKSAHMALEEAKINCHKKAYIIDFDIKGLFDNIPHELIYKALEPFEVEKWVLLYIKRWLEISDRAQCGIGTPQGGVVSPILANMFMDVCFDKWMEKNYPHISFERYADDCVVHCVSEKQAVFMLSVIEQRLNKCGIELNKSKTKLANTQGRKSTVVRAVSFDFLGYTFKPTKVWSNKRNQYFVGFSPRISVKSKSKINDKLKQLGVHRYSHLKLEEVAEILNPKIRGWCNYYGYFNKNTLIEIYKLIDNKLAKFMREKYKMKSHGRAYKLIWKISEEKPMMFYHWSFAKS